MNHPARPEPPERPNSAWPTDEGFACDVPGYQIVRLIGQGSMGVVFEARREADDVRVALKVLPPSLTLAERSLTRFVREAQLMARVQHPAIVRAFEHGQRGRLHWFAMEFVEGITLDERLAIGPLPVQQAAEIGATIARALQFAHEQGVLHRDVKPGNIMLRRDGRAAITDFGLARESGDGSMTESGSIVGTPMYMAPEQVVGNRGAIGTRSDVYGLGATLYELLAGHPPFAANNAQAVLRAVLEEEPVPPRRLRHDLPAALEAIVLKALEKDPAQRYGSAQELAEDLERSLRGERVLARRPGPAQRLWRSAARRPALSAFALATVALSLGAFGLLRERRLDRLKARVQEAENKIAMASGLHDDQLRPLSPEARRGLLEAAVESTTEVIAEAPALALAWFVRGQAQHRLQRFAEALHDLDAAARYRGGASLAVLYFRIDTLRNLPGAEARQRMLQDLTALLAVDRGHDAQCLVAESLVDLAESAGEDRASILARARSVLDQLESLDSRSAIARARLLALEGDRAGAVREIETACDTYHGDPLVHRAAATLLRRLGRDAASREHESLARRLDPLAWSEVESDVIDPNDEPSEVDLQALQGFFERVDHLMQGARRDRQPTASPATNTPLPASDADTNEQQQ
ncbi:MAG: serine/threonine-protein kinase [Planctomycetota bacterium]